MQERKTVEVFFNLGGQGFEDAAAVTLSPSGIVDNYSRRIDYDLIGKFATLEIEVYTIDQYQYPTPSATIDSTLQFLLGNTEYIFAGSLPIQNAGSSSPSGYTDQVDFNIVDGNGETIVTTPTQYYSAGNIEGSSGTTPFYRIAYLPILNGAEIINPAMTQPIYQAGGKTTEFTVTAVNTQGSFIGLTPTTVFDAGSATLSSTVNFNISLGAVNDGMSIFGTYAAPKTYTYPDGSPIPSQKQIWTI